MDCIGPNFDAYISSEYEALKTVPLHFHIPVPVMTIISVYVLSSTIFLEGQNVQETIGFADAAERCRTTSTAANTPNADVT